MHQTRFKFKVDKCCYVHLFKTSGLAFVYELFMRLELQFLYVSVLNERKLSSETLLCCPFVSPKVKIKLKKWFWQNMFHIVFELCLLYMVGKGHFQHI